MTLFLAGKTLDSTLAFASDGRGISHVEDKIILNSPKVLPLNFLGLQNMAVAHSGIDYFGGYTIDVINGFYADTLQHGALSTKNGDFERFDLLGGLSPP